jgi:hypothetical protein
MSACALILCDEGARFFDGGRLPVFRERHVRALMPLLLGQPVSASRRKTRAQ